MDLNKLQNILNAEPKYRMKQVWHFVFQKLIESWEEATSLPVALRNKLADEVSLEINAKLTGEESVKKALVRLEDGLEVETVLMRHKDGRNTVCVSSQVGCALGCSFCATGKMGFIRNLTSWEIAEQILYFSRLLKSDDQHVTNVVFMGMGEPMMNYDEVLAAIKFLHDKDVLNLGARRFSISTVGVVDGINKLAEEDMDINLAVSLHSAFDKKRSEMMPINKKWRIRELLKAIDEYIAKKNRRVMIEYILIKGLNDSAEDAEELASLLKGKLCFVNVIVYNPTDLYEPSDQDIISQFKKIVERAGIEVTERHKFGHKIDAACGQLATNSK